MKIAFVSMPLTGHLNPMTALARKLQSRGHEVVFIGVPDSGPLVRAAKLNFVSICEEEFPVGSIPATWGELAKQQGINIVRYTHQELSAPLIKATLEHLPGQLKELGVEAVVLDIVFRFVELAPMRLGLPYAHVWNILNVDGSGLSPACFFNWPYDTTPEAIARNKEGLKLLGEYRTPSLVVAKAYAEKHGMQIDWSNPAATTSKLGVVSQTPKEFDFPNIPWPPQFHYAGPFHDDEGREPISFPWEKLTGQPLIYASMGTLLNGMDHLFRAILDAAETVPDSQLVLSVGRNIDPEDLGPVPPNGIVVRSAPQIELLKQASLCITHAGLNTALESLAQGVPMVAIPIGFDQPGVAVRIAYHGAGEFIELTDLTTEKLAALMRQVLTNPAYRDKAKYFQKVIAQTRGLDIAADVIEEAFEKELVTVTN